MIETNAPLFMPVAMSISTYERCFLPLSEFMTNKVSPPRELAEQFLKNIEFVERDEYKLNIKLIRTGKNLKKGDLSRETNRVTGRDLCNTSSRNVKSYSRRVILKFK